MQSTFLVPGMKIRNERKTSNKILTFWTVWTRSIRGKVWWIEMNEHEKEKIPSHIHILHIYLSQPSTHNFERNNKVIERRNNQNLASTTKRIFNIYIEKKEEEEEKKTNYIQFTHTNGWFFLAWFWVACGALCLFGICFTHSGFHRAIPLSQQDTHITHRNREESKKKTTTTHRNTNYVWQNEIYTRKIKEPSTLKNYALTLSGKKICNSRLLGHWRRAQRQFIHYHC